MKFKFKNKMKRIVMKVYSIHILVEVIHSNRVTTHEYGGLPSSYNLLKVLRTMRGRCTLWLLVERTKDSSNWIGQEPKANSF
jgi:hypothetical protein